ncbi:MAG: class I SAM-dependent methyltransferase [Bacillota bacterium]|nr:class I SAM-dependent methyltransferase [Bacillota bacterium]
MGEKKSNLLFNIIAPIYGLFYNSQKKRFNKIINKIQEELSILKYREIIDIGCGTGALCSVLNKKGMKVTGIDPAKNMLEIAKNKPENKDINFIQANALKKLPFQNKSFDIAIASYVAHGLKTNERKQMYAEMSRVAKEFVIIYDYNDNRGMLTNVIEWLEGGNYFNFIKNAEPEMKDCLLEMKLCFSDVHIVNVDIRANWYICKPSEV